MGALTSTADNSFSRWFLRCQNNLPCASLPRCPLRSPQHSSSPITRSEHTLHTSQESLHEKLQLLGMPTAKHQFCVPGLNPHGQFLEFLLASERLLRVLGVEARVDHGDSPLLLAKSLLTSLSPFVSAETLATVTPNNLVKGWGMEAVALLDNLAEVVLSQEVRRRSVLAETNGGSALYIPYAIVYTANLRKNPLPTPALHITSPCSSLCSPTVQAPRLEPCLVRAGVRGGIRRFR